MPSYDQSALVGRFDQILGQQAHEQDDGLGLLLEVALGVTERREVFGDDVHGGAERDVRDADRRALGVARETRPFLPHRVAEQRDGVAGVRLSSRAERCEAAEQHDAGGDRGDDGGDQRVADHRAATEAGLLVGVGEGLDRGHTRRVTTAGRVPGLDELLVGHDRLRPVDRSEAEGEEREADAEADEEVVVPDADQLAVFDREQEVGGDRPDARGDRQVEERVDRADGARHRRRVLVGHPLAVRRKLGVVHRIGDRHGEPPRRLPRSPLVLERVVLVFHAAPLACSRRCQVSWTSR